MERKIILKNTETGQELTMPVTPASYPMASGRAVERLDMAQTGQIALPGLKSLFDETLEVLLPAQLYPFCTAEAVADPSYYLELLTAWSQEGQVCRYIVVGTAINSPVLLGPIEYGESDGTNDVTAKIPLYEYRYLEDVQVEQTQNSSRPTETASQPATPDSYTVKKGDSLWAICKAIYGDGSLAYKLATANSIKNPNLIYPGQVLTLPDAATLASMTATVAPSSSSSGSSTKKTTTTKTTETTAQAVTKARRSLRLEKSKDSLSE
jgi:LysM repeat protein